jgi:ribosomal protein S18 acetylase RimI-like enzyme
MALAREARRPGGTAYWHPGDVAWRLFGRTDADPRANIRLWHDGRGSLRAVAWFEPPDHVEFNALDGEEAVFDELLAWAATRRRELGVDARGVTPLAVETTSLEDDAIRLRALARHGFTRADRYAQRLRRSLADALPDAAVPAGMRLRHATANDITERVAVHRDAWSVWGPSGMTAGTYGLVRDAPSYDETLDIVIEATDGTFAACCIAWADEPTGTACFEPVGTRPRYAGQGCGKAVVVEALHRLKERGIHTAFVGTASINGAALALYRSCGFVPAGRELFFDKPLPSA